MKKILSVITAAALFLGVTGCSGDLHDKEVVKLDFGADYYLAGDMTNWEAGPLIQFTADESDASRFWAVFDATDAKQSFCFTKDASWTGQIGGDFITAGTLGKDITYESKDNGFGGYNAVLSGLTKGSTYKMVAEATDDGTIQIDCAESKAPNYFLLDGYYLKGSFDVSWAFDMKKVLMDGVKDTATGDVTYKVMFIATAATEEGIIAKFDDSSFYKGVVVSAKESEAKPLSTSADSNIKFTDLEVGKGYFVYVVTSVDGVVKIRIAEGAYIQIVGAQVVGLDSDYEGNTLVVDGSAIGGWFNKWDGTGSNKATVTNGVATVKLAEPFKLYQVGKFDVLATVANDWSKRLGKVYQEDKGNGSIDISAVPLDYTSYIIYADVSGLSAGDEIKWQFIKPTAQISVTGLPAGANGKELYFTGGFNGWAEPGKEGTYKVTVSNGAVSLVASVDADSEGKFASAGWKRPEICASNADDTEGANIKWQGLSFGKTLKGTYSKTLPHKEGGDLYICTWTVE